MMRSVLRFTAALLLPFSYAVTQWSHDPSINTVVCSAASDQYRPTAVSDGAGGAIVAWYDYRTGTADIYAQRIDVNGVTQWTPNGVVICNATQGQNTQQIVSDGSGGAIIAWEDSRSGTNVDIYAQRVDHNGVVQWTANGVVICNAANDQHAIDMIADGSGGAIITWHDARSDVNDIYAQKINSAGAVQWTANGVAVCTSANGQYYPRIASDDNGGAIIAWGDYRGVDEDIYAQRLNASGAPLWTANGVAFCTSSGNQASVVIARDGFGGAILAWYDGRSSGDIYAQRVNSSGANFWAYNGQSVSSAAGLQSDPMIVGDGNGGAIIAWPDFRSSPYEDIYAQKIDGACTPQWTTDGIPIAVAAYHQDIRAMLYDGAGGAYMAWNDDRTGTTDVYAQHVNGAGTSQWTANGLDIASAYGYQSGPSMVFGGPNGLIIAFQDSRNNTDIYAQYVDRLGYIGDYAPSIYKVQDVLNDQGGLVELSWYAAYLDAPPSSTISSYTVYRGVKPSQTPAGSIAIGPEEYVHREANPGIAADAGSKNGKTYLKLPLSPASSDTIFWEDVATVYPEYLNGYSYRVPTPSDSGPQGIPWYYFMVRARTYDASTFWNSAPMAGYSVDNLPPGPVMTVSALPQPGPSVNVHWSKDKVDPDVGLYEVHRSTVDGFTPGPSTKIGQTSDTALVDASPVNGSPNYYRIITVDIHGNKSVPSQQASAGVTLMSQYAVSDKWNLISVPLTVGNYAKSVLYPTAVSNAFSYAGGYTQQATLTNGTGYWLKFAGGQNVSMTGFLISSASIPVQAGWNLIGSISTSVPVGSISSSPGGMVASNFFGYESGYKVATQIEPGQGYWIKVNQSGNLILSGSNNLPSENRIRITPDGELPPAPPDAQISNPTTQIPTEFSLGQNYPNPFNPTTNFEYRIANIGFVSLKIFDVLGREVATLVSEVKEPGAYSVTWDATEYPSGLYFYRLIAGNFTDQKKMVLIK